jgi:F-type H+-transporting ATPase subunit delta
MVGVIVVVINEVAKVYAGALLDIGKSKNILPELEEELKSVVDVFNEDKEFKLYLKAPGITKKAKKTFINNVFSDKLSETMIHFLMVLIDKDRQMALSDIYESFRDLVDQANNRQRIKLTTSIKSDASLLKRVESALEEKLKKHIMLEEIVDQSILGGIIIKVDDLIIDGSLSKDLNNIKEKLLYSNIRSEAAYED